MGDRGLRYIAEITGLERLSLPGTVTEQGLAALQGHAAPEGRLVHGRDRRRGPGALPGFKVLEHTPELTRVTDVGMRDIAMVNTLKRVDLTPDEGRVTDRGIAELAQDLGLKEPRRRKR